MVSVWQFLMSTSRANMRSDLSCRQGSTPRLDSGADTGRCRDCLARPACFSSGLAPSQLALLTPIFLATRTIKRGDMLFRQGDVALNLYAIQSGSFKLSVVLPDGRQPILGLRLPGEPLGLDGVSTGIHTHDAIALEDCTVCLISLSKLEDLTRNLPPLQRGVYRWIGGEITLQSKQLMRMNGIPDDERLSDLIDEIAQRLNRNGLASAPYRLHLTRDELASYLGLKLETVSRTLTRLEGEQRIDLQGRYLSLHSVAETCDTH